jgi:YfiR/HmsC-like
LDAAFTGRSPGPSNHDSSVNVIQSQQGKLLTARPSRWPGGQRFVAVGTLAAVLFLTIGTGMGLAETPTSLEYKVKGAFLLNFAKFTKWPADEFARDDSPITIGIVGEDPFGSTLDQLVEGVTIGARPIVVKRLAPSDDLSQCRILFVPKSTDTTNVMKRVTSPGVLTVGESDDFLNVGGVIRLMIEDKKVRFEVNMDAADRAHLTVSSQLLKLARTVKSSNHEAIVPKSTH